jgi:TonB family protein
MIHAIPSGSEELLALQDPTLFVLPHRDNFSGEAWLKAPAQEFAPTNWTEPPLPLPLPPEELGAAFATFMQTNSPSRFHPNTGALIDGADLGPVPMPPITNSFTLRVEGDLAKLRLLTLLRLPPQTSADLLTNTVVQVLVDAQGYPFSAVVLSKSGSDAADADALALAKTVRFEPAETPALGVVLPDKMTSGKLIFEWQTQPPPATNAPPAHS